MSTILHIEIEDDVLVGMQKNPEEFAAEMRTAAAVKWYELGFISQDKAAEIAGLTRNEFIFSLKRYKVSPFQENAEDITNSFNEK